MQPISHGKHQVRNICGLLCCLGIIILGAVCCGMTRGMPYYSYSQAFSPSSGQCQGRDTVPTAGEQTLTVVVQAGPNITICILRASDGILLRHYDLALYGDVVGYGDGLLYVNERQGTAGSSLALCAVHISDGIESWCQTQLTNATTIAVANGNVYASSTDQTLVTAVSERDGRILWNFHTLASSTTNSNSPLLATGPGMVYVNAAQNLPPGSPTPTTTTALTSDARSVCALRASNGQQLWCKPLPVQLIIGMATDEHTLYVRTFNNSSIYAFDAISGAIRWVMPLSFSQTSYTPPNFIVTHGVVFADVPVSDASGSDQLYALRASDGKRLWNTSYNGLINALSATDTCVYLVTSTGKLYARNILDGTPAWSYGPPQQVTPTAVSYKSADTIYVGHNAAYILLNASYGPGNYATILAMRTNDGKLLWENAGCAPSAATQVALAGTLTTGTPAGAATPTRCDWINGATQYNLKISLYLLDN